MDPTLTRIALVMVAPTLAGCVVATDSVDGDGGGFFLLLFVAVVPFVVTAAARRASTRRRHWSADERESTRPSTAMLRAELSVLADDVVRLEPRVAMCEAAREDFEAAT